MQALRSEYRLTRNEGFQYLTLNRPTNYHNSKSNFRNINKSIHRSSKMCSDAWTRHLRISSEGPRLERNRVSHGSRVETDSRVSHIHKRVL